MYACFLTAQRDSDWRMNSIYWVAEASNWLALLSLAQRLEIGRNSQSKVTNSTYNIISVFKLYKTKIISSHCVEGYMLDQTFKQTQLAVSSCYAKLSWLAAGCSFMFAM